MCITIFLKEKHGHRLAKEHIKTFVQLLAHKLFGLVAALIAKNYA